MTTRAQPVGALGLTNFERFFAVVCWWQPLFALIALFFGSAPRSLKRHALWSVLTVVATPVIAVVMAAIFGGIGFLVADGRGAGVGILTGFLIFLGLFQAFAALLNTFAILANRGPYFTSAGAGGNHVR